MDGSSFSSFGNCSILPCLTNEVNCSGSSADLTTVSDTMNNSGKSLILAQSVIPMDCSTGFEKYGAATNSIASKGDSNSVANHCHFQPPSQLPARRLRVSDINVSRYEEEFVEIQEIASGVFGKVMVARHRLDGMVYAIKVSLKLVYFS